MAEFVVNPRDFGNKVRLLCHVFGGNQALYDEYVGYFNKAESSGSAIPDVVAWIEFRKRWVEREDGDGWRRT